MFLPLPRSSPGITRLAEGVVKTLHLSIFPVHLFFAEMPGKAGGKGAQPTVASPFYLLFIIEGHF